jgi:hypothetical protein
MKLRRLVGGLLAATLVVTGLVAGAEGAGASLNPLVAEHKCTTTLAPSGQPVMTCTFTGTFNGEPITSLDGALLYTTIVRTCPQRGVGAFPGTDIADGYYYLRGGGGVFSGIFAAGYYSYSSNPLGASTTRYGGAAMCGTQLPPPDEPTGPFGLPAPQIAASALPSTNLGRSYEAPLFGSGGATPYRWRVVAGLGKLPRGLKLDKTFGVIRGVTKRLTGTFSFVVKLKDSQRPKRTAIQSFSITVDPPLPSG